MGMYAVKVLMDSMRRTLNKEQRTGDRGRVLVGGGGHN